MVFPAPFGTEQPENVSRFDPEVDSAERLDLAVALAEAVSLDCDGGSSHAITLPARGWADDVPPDYARCVRIFLAGATGVIGVRLVPLLVDAGHDVAGMTRSPVKAGLLEELGAEPVVCDVFEAEGLRKR